MSGCLGPYKVTQVLKWDSILELTGLYLGENQDRHDMYLYAPHQCCSIDCYH